MTYMPKVSIIVPVFNVEKYLKECLDSILAQSLKEIEVICVDDGSTDKSPQILDRYQKKDKRIKVIHKDNSGYGNTMNVGLDVATGRYIGIVESDDYIDKNMFKVLYEAAEVNQVDLVKSDHYTFSSIGNKKNVSYKNICDSEFYNKVINAEEVPEVLHFTMMNWTGIYKRDFIVENNIRHNETPGASFQDNGFWIQTIMLAKRMYFINRAFYYYRQDNPNSSINNKAKVYCICDEYLFMENFFSRHQEFSSKLRAEFIVKKYFNYMNSFNRIAREYRMEFLEHIAHEFEENIKNLGHIKKEIDPWVYSHICQLVDSPQLFYWENVNQEYKFVHERLMVIRNSNEFKKGIEIKKKIGMRV